MEKLREDLPVINVLIFALIVIFFLALLAIGVEKITEAKALSEVKTDETTGCEYFVFRDILTPRLDETGTKVRGCKESK